MPTTSSPGTRAAPPTPPTQCSSAPDTTPSPTTPTTTSPDSDPAASRSTGDAEPPTRSLAPAKERVESQRCEDADDGDGCDEQELVRDVQRRARGVAVPAVEDAGQDADRLDEGEQRAR